MKKKNKAIMLITVVTIILLIIAIGITINLMLGKNETIIKTEEANETNKTSEILEKLHTEITNLVTSKDGEQPSTEEYINYLIEQEIITTEDVEDIDNNTKNIIVEGYIFIVEKESNENIKITYQGKVDEGPIIEKIEVTTNIDSISIKVIAFDANEENFNYYIKNITTGETTYVLKETTSLKEYTYTGLPQGNEFMIKVEITNHKEIFKEVGTIKTEEPQVSSIILNKSDLKLEEGETETLTVTVEPTNAIDKTVTWTSSNTNIATVNSSTGEVTAVAKGTAIITVSANNGNGATDKCCKITVSSSNHTGISLSYTWEELGEVAKAISNNYGTESGKINNKTAEVNISVNGREYTLGVGDTTTVDGKMVRILGFNHDELTDKTAYKNEDGSENTYAGISFEYLEVLINGAMNTSDTNQYGWGACNLRSILNNTTINSLENKDQIKQVKKPYIVQYDTAAAASSDDYLWLLSCGEIWNNGYGNEVTRGNAVAGEGNRYKYYDINLKDTKYNLNSTVTSKSSVVWGLRSPVYNSDCKFCDVGSSGYCGLGDVRTNNVIPGFAI